MTSLSKFSFMAILLSLGVLQGCSKTDQQTTEEKPLRPVRTLVVGAVENANWREFPGTVDAAQKAELGFRVTGKLHSLNVNEGQIVKEGEVLAKLDDTDFLIQLKSRQADYQQAHDDFLRGKSLIGKGVISQSDFSKLQAQDIAAQAALESAQRNLEYTELKAPFGGRIAKRYVENYEEVSAMQPIYALQDISSLLVKVDIPESLMITAQEGTDPEVQALFSSIPGESFPLKLKEVSSRADEATRLFNVTFSMPANPKYNILPGMSVTVRGRPPQAKAQDGAIFVPPQVVQEDGDGRYVWTVSHEGDSTGVVNRRAVTTGAIQNNGIQILSGLEEGDEVVTAGMSKMHSGLQVRLTTEGSK
ncbi:efflux RND transporter periplasmic adaptor subunit [Hahella sp. KA22]|uniref:efflux RND transporter periplasmic adaptor subunit n=1 Tax=Hahella sp. KA22 TaxID=1628392 RepID=UPI000FDEF283|nr:efflux RND transporter periplasmic adaptor subunit [Hahella sp. KA22]AZZ90670.1 efflux RND transporter periplasmic adaptor subunit [Hahella sp. KA22]QAY54040.1 efflux RND transporter periplasmic adaptor subunit [Hahella sp. KA22]